MANPEIAVELSRRAHELQPREWRYLRDLGGAHYRAGQWDKAVTALTKSTQLVDGDNAFNYLFLAMAHWQLGDKTAAADWYSTATEWMEKSDINWLHERGQMIHDIYLEAAELMGLVPREF